MLILENNKGKILEAFGSANKVYYISHQYFPNYLGSMQSVLLFLLFYLIYHGLERIYRVFFQHREPNLKFELAEKVLKIRHLQKITPAKFFWSAIRES